MNPVSYTPDRNCGSSNTARKNGIDVGTPTRW
jgi:hypothetical protein